MVQGVASLHGARYRVMPDRIEAGSYACAAGITGGDIELVGARSEDMTAILGSLGDAGLAITPTTDGIRVSADGALQARSRCPPRPSLPSRPTCRPSSWRCWRWRTAPRC